MEREELVHELRNGHAWKYADGLVVASGTTYSDKTKATDLELIKAASTCHECLRSATSDEIEEATAEAHDYDSFAAIIGSCIEHSNECSNGF